MNPAIKAMVSQINFSIPLLCLFSPSDLFEERTDRGFCGKNTEEDKHKYQERSPNKNIKAEEEDI